MQYIIRNRGPWQAIFIRWQNGHLSSYILVNQHVGLKSSHLAAEALFENLISKS